MVMILRNAGSIEVAGENYTLTCSVTGGGNITPVYRWYKNGSQLTNEMSAMILFTPLSEGDSGVYHCVGIRNSTNVSVESENVTISVKGNNVIIILIVLYTLHI